MFGVASEINFMVMVFTGLSIALLHLIELWLSWYTYNMVNNKTTNLTVSNYYRN